MAGKFPYVSSAGPLTKALLQLRKSFPKEVTADTLKKLDIAPNNETYVISTLKFLKIIDENGNKLDAAGKIFVHNDEKFPKEFDPLVRSAYHELFELHGNDAWKLDKAALTQFFRTSDQSSDIVGQRQALTFNCLAGLCGHVPAAEVKASTKSNGKGETKKSSAPSKKTASSTSASSLMKISLRA